MKNRWIFKAIKVAVLLVLVVTGIGFLVMSLWNNLVPAIWGGNPITFWQAIGLLVLGRLLFIGLLQPWGWRGYGARGEHWRKRWEEKMAVMTPEEREKIRQAYARRCGGRYRNWQYNQPESQSKETVSGGPR